MAPLLTMAAPNTERRSAGRPGASDYVPVRPKSSPLLLMPPWAPVTFATGMPAFRPANIVPLLKMLPSNVEIPHEQPTSMP